MTNMTARLSNQLADLQQLVLFPEMVGTRCLPLDLRRTGEAAPVSEREEVIKITSGCTGFGPY